MDGENRGDNQSGRGRQIDLKTTNRRRLTNGDVVNDYQNEVDQARDERNSLTLSLGSSTYNSSQIQTITTTSPPMTTSPFSPPMTTMRQPHYVAGTMSSYYMTLTPQQYLASSSWNNSFLNQMGSQVLPPANFFQPPPYFTPTRSTGEESRQSSRSSQSSANQRTVAISPPFPWATNIRGKIQTLEYLESKQITAIFGDVQCKHCEKMYKVRYNLRERFSEVEDIFMKRKRIMRERAPREWQNPEQAKCEFCGREKTVKPVIAVRKSKINWLFLLLGQTLGYCTLEQLKYFCKHSNSHRTGAKDRVLYLTYLGLCKMLEPNNELFRR